MYSSRICIIAEYWTILLGGVSAFGLGATTVLIIGLWRTITPNMMCS